MVSYRVKATSLRFHSKRLSGANFMGFSRQLVFRDSNPFNGSFFHPSTTTVPSNAGAPGPPAEGTSLVLIGDRLVLEHSPYKKDTQTEISHRHATSEKGGRATRWGYI